MTYWISFRVQRIEKIRTQNYSGNVYIHMERKEYSAGAVKHSFWFMEFRNEVKLLSEGKSFDEIKELCKMKNIFAASTPERATQILIQCQPELRH